MSHGPPSRRERSNTSPLSHPDCQGDHHLKRNDNVNNTYDGQQVSTWLFVTLKLRQNGLRFANYISSSFPCMRIVVFWFKFHWICPQESDPQYVSTGSDKGLVLMTNNQASNYYLNQWEGFFLNTRRDTVTSLEWLSHIWCIALMGSSDTFGACDKCAIWVISIQGTSNHLQLDCLFDSLLTRLTTKPTSNIHITGPLWGEPQDRWIPLTKGQKYGKHFHFMTSSRIVSWLSNIHNHEHFHMVDQMTPQVSAC